MTNYEFNYFTPEEDEGVKATSSSSTLVDILNGSVLIRPPQERDPFLAKFQGSAILHLLHATPEFIQDDRFTVPTETELNNIHSKISAIAINEQFVLAA